MDSVVCAIRRKQFKVLGVCGGSIFKLLNLRMQEPTQDLFVRLNHRNFPTLLYSQINGVLPVLYKTRLVERPSRPPRIFRRARLEDPARPYAGSISRWCNNDLPQEDSLAPSANGKHYRRPPTSRRGTLVPQFSRLRRGAT